MLTGRHHSEVCCQVGGRPLNEARREMSTPTSGMPFLLLSGRRLGVVSVAHVVEGAGLNSLGGTPCRAGNSTLLLEPSAIRADT